MATSPSSSRVYSVNVASLALSIIALGFSVVFAGTYYNYRYGAGNYDRCLQGPTFWCGSPNNYKQCVLDRAAGKSVPSCAAGGQTYLVPPQKCAQGPI